LAFDVNFFGNDMVKAFSWLKGIFVNYLWFGVMVLFIAIVMDLNYPSAARSYWVTLIIKLVEAVGVSVLIASIFTYASGTSEFVEKIKDLLEDIVVRRNFLANIDPVGKREALKALIQPSASEKNIYPNIGDYYGYFINKTLEIKGKSVRSNYVINSRAFICPTSENIAVAGNYSYRLYPSSDGFNDITVGFEAKNSFCSLVAVSDPLGERKEFQNPALVEHNEGGDISYRTTIPIKDFGEGKNHLDVELRITEYGTDHWKLIQFKALQPTDGFRFHIHCDSGILVREHATFVVGATYHLECADDRTSLSFTCNQWVNEGTGLCVLVSTPEHLRKKIVTLNSTVTQVGHSI
jgi:hypothetical protein